MKNKQRNKIIGNIIREIRIENNFTQEQFARKVLGISSRHYKRIEYGEIELSFIDFYKIISYFNLDEYQVIAKVKNLDRGDSEINILYDLINRLDIPLEIIEEKVQSFYQKSDALSPYQKKTLEMVESFVIYKKTEDDKVLKYFVENNLDFFKENMRAISLILPTLSSKKIIEFVEMIKIKNSTKKDEQRINLLLNAIGYLLERKYKNKQQYFKLFDEVEELIFEKEMFRLLPLYYRHLAIFYYPYDNEKFQENKDKALLSASILKKDVFITYLEKDFHDLEK